MVCLGAYTRLASLFQAAEKEYEGVVLFGRSTDTLDIWGRTTVRSDVPRDIAEKVAMALPAFKNGYLQEVPRYSAAKLRGDSFHRLARQGIETPPRHKWVAIHHAEAWPESRSHRRFGFRLVTGSGFYVRAWAKDLGDAVGVQAMLARLVRTRVGPYGLETAVTLDELGQGSLDQRVVKNAGAVPWIPAVSVDADVFTRLCRGQAQAAPEGQRDGPVAVVDRDGSLGLIARHEGGSIHPWIVLRTGEYAG